LLSVKLNYVPGSNGVFCPDVLAFVVYLMYDVAGGGRTCQWCVSNAVHAIKWTEARIESHGQCGAAGPRQGDCQVKACVNA
jgi:hypothetical protein